MTAFPNSPRLLKGGIVLIDPETAAVQRMINLQYNPDTLTRSLQHQGVESGGGERSEALRLTGPPVETLNLEAEIDATDQLEVGEGLETEVGIHAQLAALETIIYPSSRHLQENDRLADAGMLEIVPAEAPLTLFVWSKNRIVPVRITECSITEEAFDTLLNPIRAKVSLGLRVLNIDDLGLAHKGGSLYLSYQQQKERLARRVRPGTLKRFGIGGIP